MGNADKDQPMTSGNNNFALSVVQGMLFGRATMGARCLVFTEDKICLSYVASLHGITLPATATVIEYQRVTSPSLQGFILLRYILNQDPAF